MKFERKNEIKKNKRKERNKERNTNKDILNNNMRKGPPRPLLVVLSPCFFFIEWFEPLKLTKGIHVCYTNDGK